MVSTGKRAYECGIGQTLFVVETNCMHMHHFSPLWGYISYMFLCGTMCSKWHHRQLHGCSLETCGAQRVRDLVKSTTEVVPRKAKNSCQARRVCVALV